MRNSFLLFLVLVIYDSCVDRLNFESADNSTGVIVVEGFISDDPGPYSITLTRASGASANLDFSRPVIAKQVTISDDLGNSEHLSTRGSGVWETNPSGIRGEIGRKYSLRIEMLDGEILESAPDEMSPPGQIDDVYFEFESTKPLSGPSANGFNVFMDSQGEGGGFYRWKFTGIYQVLTFPELHLINDACPPAAARPDPLPCSGFEWTGTILRNVDLQCSCCFCWVNDFENKPNLSNDIIDSNGSFKRIEVGYVPFNEWTFAYNKYLVRVEQMSLSKEVFDFWKIIKDQKEGISSLFQPAFGRTRTNIFSTNSNSEVIGMFYATAIQKKSIFITSADSPIPVPPFEVVPEFSCGLWNSCDFVFPTASRTPPPEWK